MTDDRPPQITETGGEVHAPAWTAPSTPSQNYDSEVERACAAIWEAASTPSESPYIRLVALNMAHHFRKQGLSLDACRDLLTEAWRRLGKGELRE